MQPLDLQGSGFGGSLPSPNDRPLDQRLSIHIRAASEHTKETYSSNVRFSVEKVGPEGAGRKEERRGKEEEKPRKVACYLRRVSRWMRHSSRHVASRRCTIRLRQVRFTTRVVWVYKSMVAALGQNT